MKSVRDCQCGFGVSILMIFFSLTLTCCIRFTAATTSKCTCWQCRDPEGKSSLVWPETPQGDSDASPASARKTSLASETSHSQSGAYIRGQCYPRDRKIIQSRRSIQGDSNEGTRARDVVEDLERNFPKLPGFLEYIRFSYNNVCGLVGGERWSLIQPSKSHRTPCVSVLSLSRRWIFLQ